MRKSLFEIFSLLTTKQRKRLLWLQLLMVLTSFTEVISVLAVGAFVKEVGVESSTVTLIETFQIFGVTSRVDVLVCFASIVLLILLTSSIISICTVWILSLYGAKLGADLSSRLFGYYISQPWLFHTQSNTSQLTNNISQECQRITGGVIGPILEMNSKVIMTVTMIVAIFIYNPKVTSIGISIFFFGYLFIYKILSSQLSDKGAAISRGQAARFKAMAEGFGGIKDVLVLQRQRYFLQRFSKASRLTARAQAINKAFALVPRFAMELLAFGAMIILVLYFLVAKAGDLNDVLPILSVYALAGFKLLPAFQKIYSGIAQIKGNIASFDNVRQDLLASNELNLSTRVNLIEAKSLKVSFSMCNVKFRYSKNAKLALDGLNLDIQVNSTLGIVGASGSGKSTVIDMILGLIAPESGEILIDGSQLNESNTIAWQNNLGLVAQSIYLSDATIAENIAFGVEGNNVDNEAVKAAADMAHLSDLLLELPLGLQTRVGERGVQLSGGQRQRIGIARALYRGANVLVFDEATSALDGITERRIMESIYSLAGQKTIIMVAHRLSTVKKCDTIFLLDGGAVIDKGSYSELLERNEMFRRMDLHA